MYPPPPHPTHTHTTYSSLHSHFPSSTIPEEVPIPSTSTSAGRWLRFSDTQVEEFNMSDAALEAECFGGSYKAKPSDGEEGERKGEREGGHS